MTTYTLTGLAVYRATNDDVIGVDNTDVTLEIVVPDAATSFSYTVNPLNPGETPGQGDETVDIAVDDYTVRIDGMTVAEGGAVDPETSMFKANWTDAGGSHSTTVLVAFLTGIPVSPLGRVGADYIFVIDGAPLPNITTVAGWNGFEGSLTSIAIPTGTYGPGTDIALTDIGATTSENDLISGTSVRDVLKSGKGADKLYGGTGNDKLFGGTGNDRLFGGKGDDALNGGKGRDKLFGSGGKDTLDGGEGDDKMTGGGAADTFIFSAGTDVISDFNAVNNREKIDLSDVAAIKDFRDLKNNHTVETGNGLMIDDGDGNTLTLNGLVFGDLDKGDFIF